MPVDVRTAPLPTGIMGIGGAPLPEFTNFDKFNMDDVQPTGKPPIGLQGSDASRSMHKDRSNAAYNVMRGTLISDDHGIIKAKGFTNERGRAMVWGYSQYLAGTLDRAVVTGDTGEAVKALNGLQEYLLKDGSFNASCDGGRDRYYDDNAWVGLDLAQGFKLTGDQRYIDSARKCFDFLMQGMQSDGGMKWHEEDKPDDRPAASQGPTLQLALQLYQLTRDNKYKDAAQKLDGFMNQLRTGPNGMVIDKVDAGGHGNDGTINAYNEGTAIGSDVQMYELFHDKSKLDRAKHLADQTLNWFTDDKLHGHPPCFNAVLVRNLLQLDRVLPDGDPTKARIRPAIQRYLDHADSKSRTNQGWYRGGGIGRYSNDKPEDQSSLIDQGAFVQMHALMAMSPEQLKSVA